MKRLLPLFFVWAVVLLIYYPVFSIYFSHDDFFHFKASLTDGTIGKFLNLFGFPTYEERGYAFYRPLFREGLHNLYYSLFGLNHIPFRILSLLIHLINVTFVYTLMQKLFQRKELSFFVSFFFGVSAANVGSLYYLAGGIQSLGATMFILLTLIFFWRSVEEGRKWRHLAFLTFLLALGSHEIAVTTPILLTGLLFIKKRLIRGLRRLAPFFIVLVIFLYLDIFKIGFSSGENQYKLIFSPKSIINSLGWYTAWALGLPEMFIDFVGPKFTLNPNLMKFWGDYSSGIFFFAGVVIIILVMGVIYSLRAGILKDRRFWFLFFWFPLAVSPMLLLPFHKSTYYLNPALASFWGIIGIVIFNWYEVVKKRSAVVANILLGAFLAAVLMLSIVSIRLAEITYPAANRGRIAKKLIDDVLVAYPTLPKGATVYFRNDPNYPKISGDWGGSSKQAAFILNNEDSLQLLYKDPTLKVVYEDTGSIPDSDQVFPLVAELK